MYQFKPCFILLISYFITSCSLFAGNELSNIPPPPQKMSASDIVIPVYKKTSASQISNSGSPLQNNNNNIQAQSHIVETRDSGGTVNNIKVNNKNLPDYYIYPTSNPNLSQPNSNIAPPTWQIKW